MAYAAARDKSIPEEAESSPSSLDIWKSRIIVSSLVAGIAGGGVGLVSKHRNIHGIANISATYASNFAIVTGKLNGIGHLIIRRIWSLWPIVFPWSKNEAIMLEMGLINLAVSEVMKRGFTPLTTVEIVWSSVVEKCGFQSRGANTQGSDQCLIGTAEIPVGGIHLDSIIPESSLPLKYVAISHCFRNETGAASTTTRTMDMASEDLGAPAYRKFDVEA